MSIEHIFHKGASLAWSLAPGGRYCAVYCDGEAIGSVIAFYGGWMPYRVNGNQSSSPCATVEEAVRGLADAVVLPSAKYTVHWRVVL